MVRAIGYSSLSDPKAGKIYTAQSLKTQGQVPKTTHLAGHRLLGSSVCCQRALEA